MNPTQKVHVLACLSSRRFMRLTQKLPTKEPLCLQEMTNNIYQHVDRAKTMLTQMKLTIFNII